MTSDAIVRHCVGLRLWPFSDTLNSITKIPKDKVAKITDLLVFTIHVFFGDLPEAR